MKRSILSLAGVAAFAASSASFAYTADFTDTTEEFIDGDVYVTPAGNEYVFTGSPDLAHVDGSVNAQNVTLPANNGGIGVCTVDLSEPHECALSSDDGIDDGEVLTLTFKWNTTLDDIWFNNANHTGPVGYTNAAVSVDGGAYGPVAAALGVEATTFDFMYTGGQYGGLYLAGFSTVPVPAAGILFGTALIGFLGYTRRKSKLEEAA